MPELCVSWRGGRGSRSEGRYFRRCSRCRLDECGSSDGRISLKLFVVIPFGFSMERNISSSRIGEVGGGGGAVGKFYAVL